MAAIDTPDVKQQKLDLDLLDDPTLPFISDWNGTHPYAAAYVGDPSSYAGVDSEIARYWWFINDVEFIDRIRHMHARLDGHEPAPHQIIPGPGSSTFISAYILWLVAKGVQEVYYLPPIYFTFHYFAKTFGIRLRQISGRHVFEPRFSMNLPRKRTHLIMSDPVWYAGKVVPEEVIDHVRRWQLKTGSEVFVDGSFQYLRWGDDRSESSAKLPSGTTWRLLCPAKALGVPAYRFAYVIVPPEQYKDFRWFYEAAVGSNSIGDVKFARRSIDILGSTIGNGKFTRFLGSTYRALVSADLIESSIHPDCSYFVFARLKSTSRRPFRRMDQSYFEQSRYPDYIRVNLMLADQIRELLQ